MKQPEPVSIAEAAHLLRLSDDAVRKRIKRGELHARKMGKVWRVYLPTTQKDSENTSQNGSGTSQIEAERLIARLDADLLLLREQLGIKDEQITQNYQLLSQKDEQIRKLQEDVESWREQVRYKELQIAQLQDRMIQLPSIEEPEPTEQGSEIAEPPVGQAGENGNAMSRFWHWFIGK